MRAAIVALGLLAGCATTQAELDSSPAAQCQSLSDPAVQCCGPHGSPAFEARYGACEGPERSALTHPVPAPLPPDARGALAP